ncbi:MAG: acyltransferase family protein [Aulosira sp. ZfuVER01]
MGFLRFLLAILVVIQHSYVLGDFGNDLLSYISKGKSNSGSLAVHCFFIISGFLITRSYLATSNFGHYLWNRILRIFPGF